VFELVHQKMGTSGKKTPKGFHVKWQNGQTLVDQVFATQFSLGEAEESFIWVIQQDRLRLLSYHIESANLR